MKRKHIFPYLLALLFIGLIALRVIHISADPPIHLSWSGGLFFDEGALAHNARNKVLFGAWKFDEWNDFYYSPLLTYVKWLVFRVFGVGIAQLRIVPIMFSGLTLWTLYVTLKLSFPLSTTVLSLILLGVNYLYVMYSRIGLTETPLLFFMMFTCYFWQVGLQASRTSHKHWLMFGAGVSCFSVYIFKALAVYFLPVPLVALLLLILFSKQKHRQKELLFLSGTFLAGMLMTAGIWYVLFYAPNYHEIHQAGEYVKMLSFPTSLSQFWENILRNPLVMIFQRTPVVFVMSWLYLIYLFSLLWTDRATIQPLDLFMALWFLAHVTFFFGYAYRPTRYYLPIIPPMVVLAARGIMSLWRIREIRFPGIQHLAGWLWGVSWVLGTVLWVYVLAPALYSYGFLPFVTIPRTGFWPNLVVGILLSGVVTIGLFWGYLGHRGTLLTVPPLWLFKGAALGLVSVACIINAEQYYQWAMSPRYVVKKVSRELGALLPEGSLIAGLATPMLSMENTLRPLYVWDNFVNYRQPFQKYPVTHLFLAEFNDELGYYYRSFPEVMKRATLVKTYWIKGSPFHLFSLLEPSIEAITPSQTEYQSDEPVTVTIEVKNNHPEQSGEVEVGWLLQSQSDQSAPIFMKTNHIAFAAFEQKAVTLSEHVPTGIYRLMAGFFPPEQRVYEAERLSSQLGHVRDDADAQNGKAQKAAQFTQGFLVYGPYHKFPPGKYEVAFRIKYTTEQACPQEQSVAVIEVTSDTGESVLTSRELREKDFQQKNSYETFPLEFFLESSPKLEFRVFTSGCAEVWVDQITVMFLRGVWYPESLVVQK